MDSEAPFVHRTVSAAGARSPVPPGAVNSPFEMGRKYAAAAAEPGAKPTSTPRRGRGPSVMPRARETLAARGSLTIEQLAKALDLDVTKTRKLADNGVRAGHWTMRKNDSGDVVIKLSPPPITSDKAKLRRGRKAAGKKPAARKGTAQPRKAPAKALKRAGRTVAPSSPRSVPQSTALTAVTPAIVPGMVCGLFNTGELRIEAGDQVLRLSRPQTRALVQYLDQLSHALQE